LFSCKNDVETINALTGEMNLPDQTAFNVEIEYSDNGIAMGKIISPELNIYDRAIEPYIEFPSGMEVMFYDSLGNTTSYIKSNYAIFYREQQLWEARDNVIAEEINKAERLETEQLFWDQEAKLIYTDKFSKITNADGVFYGERGFEADQDMSYWTLKGSKGTVNVSEE